MHVTAPLTTTHAHGVCVVIPTYNNAGTLPQVVAQVQAYGLPVMVVDDGCTDATGEWLRQAKGITVVSYTPNRGKGYALRQGFERARRMGYSYVLTIDADGQHKAHDIPRLLQAHAARPEALIIGSRNLNAEHMPRGNTFANRFSNFWFAVQTAHPLPDTQTGFRIYPLCHYGRLWWLTWRYEAELELLVWAVWKGAPVCPVTVDVYYPPRELRVSHFRPYADFLRISLLNTVLCVLAVVYGYPRMLITRLCR